MKMKSRGARTKVLTLPVVPHGCVTVAKPHLLCRMDRLDRLTSTLLSVAENVPLTLPQLPPPLQCPLQGAVSWAFRWNQLDLAIVLLSIMGITLEEIEVNASLPINPTIIRIMRVLRIARGQCQLPAHHGHSSGVACSRGDSRGQL